jgi:NADH-quinone oxidoreductase subunit C
LAETVTGDLLVGQLRSAFGAAVLETSDHRGDHTAVVDRARVRDVLQHCRDEPELAFDVLMDLTAVDYSRYPGREDGPRFEVVYHLYSLTHNHRLRLKVRIDEDDPVVPSAVPVWPIADWLEREVWDMFGVRFDGHPNLRRLLLYEEFVGHPLRKDYPINRRQPLIGPKA